MSLLFANPSDLYAVADRIDRHADAARAHASTLGTHLAHLEWSGIAATAFRGQAAAVMHDLRAAAGRLNDAADALRRHAANVESALHSLASLFLDGVGVGADILHTVGDLVTNPGNLLNDGRELLGDIANLGPQIEISELIDGLNR